MAIGLGVSLAYGGRYFLHYSSMTQADYLKANWQWYCVGMGCLLLGYAIFPLRKNPRG